jgi:hypothetical protein
MKKDRLDEIRVMKSEAKEKIKGKKPDKLTAKEKDELLLMMARMLGLIE